LGKEIIKKKNNSFHFHKNIQKDKLEGYTKDIKNIELKNEI